MTLKLKTALIRTNPTHRKICVAEFVDKSHGFWFILAVENVKLEMPLLIKITNNIKLLYTELNNSDWPKA